MFKHFLIGFISTTFQITFQWNIWDITTYRKHLFRSIPFISLLNNHDEHIANLHSFALYIFSIFLIMKVFTFYVLHSPLRIRMLDFRKPFSWTLRTGLSYKRCMTIFWSITASYLTSTRKVWTPLTPTSWTILQRGGRNSIPENWSFW